MAGEISTTGAWDKPPPDHDPALDSGNQHHHQGHVHHNDLSEKGRDDNVAYVRNVHGHHTAPPPLEDSEKHQAQTQVLEDEKTESAAETPARSWDWSISGLYRRFRLYVHIFIFLLFTGWWIASLVLHRNDMNWIIPFLLWFAITWRLVFFHIPITILSRPIAYVWKQTGTRFSNMVPEKLRIPAGALLTIAVICAGAFGSAETADNTRANRAVSLFGLVVFTAVLYATSRNRKRIVWRTVIVGYLMQFIIALFVLRTQAGYDIFNFVAELARDLLGFAADGVAFLTTPDVSKLHWFLISTLPAILFFVSFVSVLYYWGVLQWAIQKAAVFFFWALRVSGAEAIVAAASPFIGQGENVLLVRPFVEHMTDAEIHQVMTSGFATISGSVLTAYIGLGVNGSALISCCIMSIPASLALSKLRWPETEETLTSGRVVIPDDDQHQSVNTLHAFAKGCWLGLKIAVTILATLLCIIAIVGLIDGLLTWWGRYININNPPLTLELILGYICYPIAFLLGVPRSEDLFKVAQLIGVKLVENEFVAFTDLQTDPAYANLSARSRLIVTYALCGFANIGSLGNQIGLLSQIAPGRAGDVARIATSALITGALSTFTSASIAGMLVTDQAAYFTPTAAS